MEHLEGRFAGVRGASIYYQAWLPTVRPRAVILIVHGLGEHSGRYGNLVEYLVPRGYALYALDHLGHGQSEGAREVVQRFDDYTATLAQYEALVRGWQPETPLFLFGHSLGGLIAADYLLPHPDGFSGAILSAPAVKVSDTISPTTIALGKLLSTLAPRLGLLPLETAALARDPAVVQAYENDPLVFHGKTPARLASEMLRAIQRVEARANCLALPLLVLQGAADRIVDPAGAQMLHDAACSPDKTLHVYPGLYHEIFNEPERAQVLGDISAWLDARC